MSRGNPLARSVGFCLCVITRAALAQPFTIEPIASPGHELPGIPGSTFVSASVDAPMIDNSGRVLFTGTWLDGTTQRGSLFYGDSAGLVRVQNYLDTAPGVPGAQQLLQNWRARLSRTGIVAVRDTVGPSVTSIGAALYVGTPTNLQLAAYTGGPAPGVPGHTVAGMIAPLVNSSAQIAYFGGVHDPASPPNINYQAITAGPVGGLAQIASGGAVVPAIPGATYVSGSLGASGFIFNDAGQVGFYAQIAGPGVTSANDQGLFLASSAGDAVAVAREGAQAPTLPTGVKFAGFGNSPRLSNTGSVEFVGRVQGPGVDSSNEFAVWAGTARNLHPIFQQGGPGPGIEPGVHVTAFDHAWLNNLDETAVTGHLAGPGISPVNDQVLWMGPLDAPQVLLREGAHAFGLPDNVVFTFDGPSGPALGPPIVMFNDAGDIVLLGAVAGPGVTSTNNVGLWFRESDSPIWRLILRSGETFDGRVVAPIDILGTGTTFVFGGGSGGLSQGLNADGTFTTLVGFTDGSRGIYRFSVPEPATLALILASAVALGRAPHPRVSFSSASSGNPQNGARRQGEMA